MVERWNKGDVIISLGGTIDKSKKFSPSFSTCVILEVGDKDLLVTDYPKRKFSKISRAPKDTCILLKVDESTVSSSRPQDPYIGDLVLSFSGARYEDRESFTGILYSIAYKHGKPDTCKVLMGEEFKSAQYDDLLVLQTRSEQNL